MARRPAGELRQEILAATIGLLREHGDPERVSIEAVVKAVGCTPPTLYYYFANKSQLLVEACAQEYAAFGADLARATPETVNPRRDAQAMGSAYITWAREHPVEYRLLFMTPLGLGDDDPDFVEGESGAPQMPDLSETPGLGDLVRLLARAQAAGSPVRDPNTDAFALWGIVHGFSSLAVTEPTIPLEFLIASVRRASESILGAAPDAS